MRWTLLIACSLLVAPLTGCLDQGDDGGDGEAYSVSWESQPQDRKEGQPMEMTWRVDGPSGEIPHTGVHWANESVSDPQSPADYGNTSGAVEPAQVPDTFDTEVTFDEPGTYYFRAHAIADEGHHWSQEVEVEVQEEDPLTTGVSVTIDDHTMEAAAGENVSFNWSLTGAPDEVERTQIYWGADSASDPTPSAYDERDGTEENASVPGSYNASFQVDEPGTYNARAHAVHDGSHYWSDEVSFEVSSADGEPQSEAYNVTIQNFMYDPSERTVHPGDNITWENADAATHTVTFDNETLGDSGDIESGENYTLTVPEDIEPGTYAYTCTHHPTMEGSITVEEP